MRSVGWGSIHVTQKECRETAEQRCPQTVNAEPEMSRWSQKASNFEMSQRYPSYTEARKRRVVQYKARCGRITRNPVKVRTLTYGDSGLGDPKNKK
jgi:hypothetical protein